MNTRTAYENFRKLKDDIEKDGKIDMFEVNVLLEFIEPYCEKNEKEFVKLKNLLLRANEKGLVEDKDSPPIIESIYEILRCLRKEAKIERTLNYIFAAIALISLFYYVFYC